LCDAPFAEFTLGEANGLRVTRTGFKRHSHEGLRMNEERTVARGPELGRWLFVAALLLVGLALYFVYAPESEPPARPAVPELR
jgi:hypothetical protein